MNKSENKIKVAIVLFSLSVSAVFFLILENLTIVSWLKTLIKEIAITALMISLLNVAIYEIRMVIEINKDLQETEEILKEGYKLN